MLEQERFHFGDEVDVFDAGPLLTAPKLEIRSVAESKIAPLGRVVAVCDDEQDFLVSNERLGDFRCCLGHVDEENGVIALPRDVALAIGARLGDPVRYVTARPEQ